MAFLALSAALLIWITSGTPAIPATASAELEQSVGVKYVALTFDDGPTAKTTGRLLDGLYQRGAKATFFLVGNRIAVNQELVLRMKAEGHQVGNHTWDHSVLKGVNSTVEQEEISRTDAALRELLGDGTYWVRPPYGLLNSDQLSDFSVPLVSWSLDPKDWKRRNTAGDVQAVVSRVQPNDIILMHDSFPTSVDAALEIVDTLKARGYVFVTVEELLSLNGIEAQPGVIYCSGRTE